VLERKPTSVPLLKSYEQYTKIYPGFGNEKQVAKYLNDSTTS